MSHCRSSSTTRPRRSSWPRLAVEPNKRRRLIVELLARTGMRVGELGGLADDAMYRLGDTWWLRIPLGKLHNDRTVPLHPMLVGLINDYRAWRGPTATGLLVERDDHQPMDARTIYRHVAAVGRRAGVAHVHPHALRHTLATQCINRGMSLEAIAALLGHRSPRMTLVYARISDSTVAEQYFSATGALEAGSDTAAARIDHDAVAHAARASPTAARQRSLHPTRRAGLPLPHDLRRLRLLPDRTRVHPHPAPPTRRRHRPRRRRPHPALQPAHRRHRRHPPRHRRSEGRQLMNVDDTTVNLRPEEVVELREMLEFLCDWLNDRRVAASYRQFTFGLLTVDELRADLARFAFLLGGDGYLLDDTDEP